MDGDVREDDHVEAASGSELAKELRVAGLAMAEAEVFADEDGADV